MWRNSTGRASSSGFSINASLIACQDKESCGGAPLEDEKIESSKSSSFPLPYPRGIPVKDPTKPSPKEKRRAYPINYQGHFPYEEPSIAIECKNILQKKKAEEMHPRNRTPLVLSAEDFFQEKKKLLVTPTTSPTPLPRI